MADRRSGVGGREAGRGRYSTRPGEIPRAGWRDILWRCWDQIGKDNVGFIAAGVAFYGLLGIFPAIAALVSIYGLIADPEQVRQQFEAVASFMPEGASQILGDQLNKVSGAGSGALSLAAAGSILLALWSASRGTKAFMTAMNIAYGEEERRGFLRFNLTALALIVFVVLLAVLAISGIVLVPVVLNFLGLGSALNWAISLARWPILAVVFVFALSVLYRFAPSRETARWRWISPGSVVAVLLWLVGSAAFSVYVRNFGSYNETYGSLGAVVAMMMWFWLSAFIVILGAELNSEMERQTRRDTTTGQPQPMGSRGAYAADTVGDRR